MKTLVVLSALASIAIAAPALPEDGFENTQHDIQKSPSEESHSSFDTGTTAVARTFVAKKPLIVKNKHGYRLYRDSEEEKALSDSHQTCARQIRVKLCDEDTKFREMLSSTHEDIHTSEDEINHSLKIAKEAVENLQRDLKKIETHATTKMTPENPSSEELHEEIEVARDALEHVQKTFGNLESMSLHAVTAKDLDNMHDMHLTIAKTEEDRMAQWKEAIENIHKNVELARNIEDSFKSTPDTSSPLVESAFPKTEPQFQENIDTLGENIQVRSNDNINQHTEKKDQETDPACKVSNQNHAMENDMNMAASTIAETHIEHLHNDDSISSNEQKDNLSTRKSELLVNEPMFGTLNDQTQERSDLFMKPAGHEGGTEVKTETLLKHSDDFFDTIIAPSETVIAPSISIDKDDTDITFKNAQKMMDTSELNTKTDQGQTGLKIENQQLEANPITQLEKAAESSEQLIGDTMKMEQSKALPNLHTEENENAQHTMKSTEQEATNINLDTEQEENFMFVKSADPTLHKNLVNLNHNNFGDVKTLTGMKSAESPNNIRHEKLANWLHEHKNMDKLSSMKAAEEIMKEFHNHDHMKHMNFNEHHHMQEEMDSASEFGMADHTHHSGMFHHNMMTHGKMADMRGGMHPNIHTGMRDTMEGFGSENMFRWNPSHETARSAYGSSSLPSMPSTGAVGVFPNANAGGCGIPLLLSCSPSVVSGSLAKPHPAGSTGSTSYPAQAYRSEDDFSFHNKRDIKNANDILATNILRSPMLKQKIIKTVDNKF